MKKFISAFLSLILLLSSTNGFAAGNTFYLRDDGGTGSRCNGTAWAPDPGSGTNQNCSWNNPVYALGNWKYQSSSDNGTNGAMTGGDTLIVDQASHIPATLGQQAQYSLGMGTPGWVCGANFDCALKEIPSGTPSAPTRILGMNYATCDNTAPSAKAQFWGSERTPQLLRAIGKHDIVLECLDLTDHSNCTENGPTNACKRTGSNDGPWAPTGMAFDGTSNVTMRNIDLHGMANRNMYWLHASGTWYWSYVNIVASGQAGVDTDASYTLDDSFTATLWADHGKVDWSGCQENFPFTGAFDSAANIRNASCSSQGQNGSYTDGWGQGDAPMGNLYFSDYGFRWNSQDGFDSLHSQGTGQVIMSRVHAEGNDGMQVKTNSGIVKIENSVLIGNCNFYDAGGANPLTYTGSGGFDNVCRGPGGEPVAIANGTPGQQAYLYNNTMVSNADVILVWTVGGSACNGSSKIVARNNIFLGGNDALSVDLAGGFYIDNTGGSSCVNSMFDEDYNLWFGTKEGAAGPVGGKSYGPHSRYANPLLNGQATLKLNTAPYYQGTAGLSLVNLTATSPARAAVTGVDAADESITFSTFGSADYYHTTRTGSWDTGAITFGSGSSSCGAQGSACSSGANCCSNVCASNVCAVGSCASTGNACVTNSNCCSNTCCSGQCSASSCQTTPATPATSCAMSGKLGS